jgi:hypothetical protein
MEKLLKSNKFMKLKNGKRGYIEALKAYDNLVYNNPVIRYYVNKGFKCESHLGMPEEYCIWDNYDENNMPIDLLATDYDEIEKIIQPLIACKCTICKSRCSIYKLLDEEKGYIDEERSSLLCLDCYSIVGCINNRKSKVGNKYVSSLMQYIKD